MTTAVVTGFTVHTPLMRASFAPLIALRREGVLDRILYVTWDSGDLDGYLAPLSEWPEVELIRIPMPVVTGNSHQRGFVYQSRNLAAALSLVNNPDELVVKLRPDFLFDPEFLKSKIGTFATWGASPDFTSYVPIAMPRSPFKARIWVPWANANEPFVMEDVASIGRAGDLVQLTDPRAEELVKTCGDEIAVSITHVLRFVMPFLKDYPIFEALLRHYHLFPMDDEPYRAKLVPLALADLYFWHLAIAHAYILATCFHVDCGRQGQLRFIRSADAERYADRPICEIPDNVLYRNVETWRQAHQPGTLLPILAQWSGRLVDDDWQRGLFSGPVEGCGPEMLFSVLQNLGLYRRGLLKEAEQNFYTSVTAVYREHFAGAA